MHIQAGSFVISPSLSVWVCVRVCGRESVSRSEIKAEWCVYYVVV